VALVVTLEQLEADASLYADLRPTGAAEFVTTTQRYRLINQHIRKWQDLLIAQRPQDQDLARYTFALVPGTQSYAYPVGPAAPVHSWVSAELQWSPTHVEPIGLIAPADLWKYASVIWGQGTPKGYTAGEGLGQNLLFYPTPTSAATAVFRYIPAHSDLVTSPGTPNTINTYNGWDKFIALGVAIEMLAIAGRDASHLVRLYDEERKRLETLAAERITYDPKYVREVYPEGIWSTHDWARRLPLP
jgi:hypothetical protein